MGKKNIETKIIYVGSDPKAHHGSLSDPIYKNSTLIFNNYKAFLEAKKDKFNLPYYGRLGNYTTKRFEKIISKLYESEASVVTSSGLSAITISLLTFLKRNDEILVTENCYEPVYNFCSNELVKFGIKSKYFKNNNICALEKKITQNTKIFYLESPGSLNYEVEDIGKIVKLAKKRGILTIIDNTWATFLGCNPIKLGIDIVIESCTKYFSGHSDNFSGIIACSTKNYKKLKQTAVRLGDYVSAESCSSAVKGLRTLDVRLNKHFQNAKGIFKYLRKKKVVKEIIFPPDINNKYYKLWKKYFTNGNGLITFAIEENGEIKNFIDSLNLFKIGFSWGGYESLILPINQLKPQTKYSKNSWYWFRIHVGLESLKDLIEDLEKGFTNYEKK